MHAIGWSLGWLVFAASGAYRRRFLDNARQAGVSRAQWMAAVGESGKMVLELPRLWLGRAVPAEIDGEHPVESALALGKGVLILTPHLGCFEVIGQVYARRFGPLQPMTAMFRPPRQAWLHTIVSTARARPGLLTAPATMAGVKQMIKALRQGQCVCVLPDQVPPQGMGRWTPFFGREAYTMTLAVRLAQQTGATVLLAWGERLSMGRGFCVHFEPLPDAVPADGEAAVRQLNQAMEGLIRRSPGQYLWGYARYKQPRHAL